MLAWQNLVGLKSDFYGVFMIRAFIWMALLTLSIQAETIATGTFKSKSGGIEASGGFEVTADGNTLKFFTLDNFKMSSGPDLYVVFHPLTSDAVNEGNAKTASFRLDKLKKNSGKAEYALPAGFDITKWKSVLVHCWQFNHLYSAAAVIEFPKPTALNFTNAKKLGSNNSTIKIIRQKGQLRVVKGNEGGLRQGKYDQFNYDQFNFDILGAHRRF